MKEITVNNDRTLTLTTNKNGIEVITQDGGGGIENSYIIPDGDIVMLLNYWRNCKAGIEKSDYISEGKVINTNVIGEIEYL
jgi:hypothetical protein